MNYTLESSANLQKLYESHPDKSIQLQAWHELHKRWQEQPLPQMSSSGGNPSVSSDFYSRPIHFMPRP